MMEELVNSSSSPAFDSCDRFYTENSAHSCGISHFGHHSNSHLSTHLDLGARLDRIYMFSLPIDSRHPYWIGSTVWRLYKFFTSVFRAFNFSTLFSSLGIHLVPVLENSSDNPSIMFSKLFHGERNSPKAVLFVWHTSVWKVLTHVCRSSWSNMVSFRLMFID